MFQWSFNLVSEEKRTNQVLEHESEYFSRVYDVMQCHDVGMFQILQQRHWKDHNISNISFRILKHTMQPIWEIHS